MTTLLFAEKPLLRAVFGTAGAAARGEISGDGGPAVLQCGSGPDDTLRRHGNGTSGGSRRQPRRRADGTPAQSGLTAELAARLVNVALALKSDEESGATLDLVSVDLYTGTARLFKAGAARAPRAWGQGPGCGRSQPADGHPRRRQRTEPGGAVWRRGTMWCWCRTALSGRPRLGDAAAGTLRCQGRTARRSGEKLVEAARARAVQRGRPDDITAAVLRLENS